MKNLNITFLLLLGLLLVVVQSAWSQLIYETEVFAPLESMSILEGFEIGEYDLIIAGTQDVEDGLVGRSSFVRRIDTTGSIIADFRFEDSRASHTELKSASFDEATGQVSLISFSYGDNYRNDINHSVSYVVLDSNFTLVHEKTIDVGRAEKFISAMGSPSGGIVLSGYTLTPERNYDGYVTSKYDGNLQLVWKKVSPHVNRFSPPKILEVTNGSIIEFSQANLLLAREELTGELISKDSIEGNFLHPFSFYRENGKAYASGYDFDSSGEILLIDSGLGWEQQSWNLLPYYSTNLRIEESADSSLVVSYSLREEVRSRVCRPDGNFISGSSNLLSGRQFYRRQFLPVLDRAAFFSWNGRSCFTGYRQYGTHSEYGIYTLSSTGETISLVDYKSSSEVHQAIRAKLFSINGDSIGVLTELPDGVQSGSTVFVSHKLDGNGVLVSRDTLDDTGTNKNTLRCETLPNGDIAFLASTDDGYRDAYFIEIYNHRGNIKLSVFLDSLPNLSGPNDVIQSDQYGNLHIFLACVDGSYMFIVDPVTGLILSRQNFEMYPEWEEVFSVNNFVVLKDLRYFFYHSHSSQSVFLSESDGEIVSEWYLGSSRVYELPKSLEYFPLSDKVLLSSPSRVYFVADLVNETSEKKSVPLHFAKQEEINDLDNTILGRSIRTYADSISYSLEFASYNIDSDTFNVTNGIFSDWDQIQDWLRVGEKVYVLKKSALDNGDVLSVVAFNFSMTSSADDLHDVENLYSVYPNPTTGEIYFESPLEGLISIEILDGFGKTIVRKSADSRFNSVAIPAMSPSGVYYLRIVNELNQFYTSKIFKQ